MAALNSDSISGAASGAATGATIGSVVPGVGTAIGAAAGAVVGFASGLLGNKKKKLARKYTRQANEQQRRVARLRSFAEQRNLLRTGQVATAASLNSSVSQGVDVASSAFQGSRGSIYSQLLDNYTIGEKVVAKQERANELLGKADKATSQYQSIGDITGAVFALGKVGAGFVPQGGGDDLSTVSNAGAEAPRRPASNPAGGLETFPVP